MYKEGASQRSPSSPFYSKPSPRKKVARCPKRRFEWSSNSQETSHLLYSLLTSNVPLFTPGYIVIPVNRVCFPFLLSTVGQIILCTRSGITSTTRSPRLSTSGANQKCCKEPEGRKVLSWATIFLPTGLSLVWSYHPSNSFRSCDRHLEFVSKDRLVARLYFRSKVHIP